MLHLPVAHCKRARQATHRPHTDPPLNFFPPLRAMTEILLFYIDLIMCDILLHCVDAAIMLDSLRTIL